MDNLFAGGIFIFGILGLLLVALKNKWGFVLALIGQIMFTIAAFADGLKGLFIYSVILIPIWCFGIYKWFYPKKKD